PSSLPFTPPPTPQTPPLSLHDALPISAALRGGSRRLASPTNGHRHLRSRHQGVRRRNDRCQRARPADQGRGVPRPRRSFGLRQEDRKSTRLNSSHQIISYAVFCLKKKK